MSSRGRWIFDKETGTMIPAVAFYMRQQERREHARSQVARPYVIGTMPEIKSMADGRIYNDKRGYYKSVARAGCEIVGFDRDVEKHIPPAYNEKAHEAEIVADVKRAIEETT